MEDDRTRFEQLYRAYSGLILAYAARRTGDIEAAADVVAETFTVAWRRMEDVPSGVEARPWLYGVARRIVANHHRTVVRRRRLDERLIFDGPAPLVDESDQEDVARIAAAFGALNDNERELLTLVGWDGLRPAEIAVVLGWNAATVRLRLHRARRRFERELSAVGVQRSSGSGHESDRWATAHPDLEEA